MISQIRNPLLRRSLVVVLAAPVALLITACHIGLALLAAWQDVSTDVRGAWRGPRN